MKSASQRRSPYQGLIPYEADDAPFFFGREKETRLIVANLFAAPLTLLYGASGVGKSSVLRAGVINHLRARNDLLVVEFHTWQSDSLGDLKAAVAAAVARTNGQLVPPVDPISLAEYLTTFAAQLDRRLMIILDQFEEYFLYHPQEDVFADEFPNAVMQADAPVSFLISIREDSLAKLDRFEGHIPILFDNYLRIEHLDRQAARTAIEGPIESYNRLHAADGQQVRIKRRLVEAVLEEVETGRVLLGDTGRGMVKGRASTTPPEGRIETPYLQLVMTHLWNAEMQARSRILRLETLNSLGGAERIVRTHLDGVMSRMESHEREIAAHIFHYLVTPSGTKIAHTVTDLAEYASLPETQLTPVLEKLSGGDVRILRPVASMPGQPTVQRYEIFHDALAPGVLDWRVRYMQDWRLQNQPWGLLRNLSTGQEYHLKGALVSIGRTTAWWQNYIDLPWWPISRIHLLISRDLLTLDMHSTNGTAVNAEFHPYGPPKQLETGDIIVLAGIAPLQFWTKEYPDLEYRLDQSRMPAVEEPRPPSGWGMLIDGSSRTVTYLDRVQYYLTLDEQDRIVVKEERTANAFLMIQRRDSVEVILEYQGDDGFLLATFKKEVSLLLLPGEVFPFKFAAMGMWPCTHREVRFQIVPIVPTE